MSPSDSPGTSRAGSVHVPVTLIVDGVVGTVGVGAGVGDGAGAGVGAAGGGVVAVGVGLVGALVPPPQAIITVQATVGKKRRVITVSRRSASRR